MPPQSRSRVNLPTARPGVGLGIGLSRSERSISANYSADAPVFQPFDAAIEGESIRENSARSTKQRARTVPKSESISSVETLPVHFSPEVNAPEPFVPILVIIQAPDTIAEPILPEAVPVDEPITNVAPEQSHEASGSNSTGEDGIDNSVEAPVAESNPGESDEPSPSSSGAFESEDSPESSNDPAAVQNRYILFAMAHTDFNQ